MMYALVRQFILEAHVREGTRSLFITIRLKGNCIHKTKKRYSFVDIYNKNSVFNMNLSIFIEECSALRKKDTSFYEHNPNFLDKKLGLFDF